MSTIVTLDSIRDAAERKYGSIEIPISEDYAAVLVNALRLPEAKRNALIAMQERMNDEGESQKELLEDCLRLVCMNLTMAERLIETLDGDLAMLVEVFSIYGKGTELGEASASQD